MFAVTGPANNHHDIKIIVLFGAEISRPEIRAGSALAAVTGPANNHHAAAAPAARQPIWVRLILLVGRVSESVVAAGVALAEDDHDATAVTGPATVGCRVPLRPGAEGELEHSTRT